MARKRTRKPKLPKLLEGSQDIIAVVDSDFELIFANDACCRWLDIHVDELVGMRLKYTSANQNKSGADGICPSPEYFSTHFSSAQGYIRNNRKSGICWKLASFVAIGELDHEGHFVLIVGSGPDLDSPDLVDEKSAHAKLARMFEEIGGDFPYQIEMDCLIGESDFSIQLRRKFEAVSANHADCLVVGPNGSGREKLARSIFAARKYESTSLVPIHCAIADSQFIQNSIKEWVFDQRENNSNDWLLLLDVDKLTPESQLELFGYCQLPNFSLRILATSEQELTTIVETKEFHSGLAMLLGVQVIQLAPLSKRKNDIPLLVQHFIEELNTKSEKQIGGLSEQTTELFFEYKWPGDVRELQACVQEAHGNCDQFEISPEHLPDSFRHALSASRIGYHDVQKIDMEKFLADIERQLIQRALNQTGNNKTKSAEILGISRARFLRRATALGIIGDEPKSESNQIDSSAFKEADR